MPYYPQFFVTDAGKVLAFPLLDSAGNPNDFTGASGQLIIHDEFSNQFIRIVGWNPATNLWEYPVVAGEFPPGRYWARVVIVWPGGIADSSTEVIFDVLAN